jgi:hypothetical protein
MTTPFHSQYWAHELTLRSATGSIESLSRSIAGARVDLNPQRDDLIARIEKQLSQRHTLEPVFAFRRRLV